MKLDDHETIWVSDFPHHIHEKKYLACNEKFMGVSTVSDFQNFILQLFVYILTTWCFMIYKTNQSFEFFDDKFSISRIFTLEIRISRILGEPFEKSHI